MSEYMINKDLKKRIIEISYKHKLSHLGSCLTAVDIINEIYSIKKSGEKFVLSSGHAGLALYCVIEMYAKYCTPEGVGNYLDAEKIFEHHGVHPDRCKECDLDCSAGSLGQGLPIAVGMALADRSKNVYCLISDGECAEGSVWEALRIKADNNLDNLHIFININGWAAYMRVDNQKLIERLRSFDPKINIRLTDVEVYPFLAGQAAHYYIMKEEDYRVAMEVLK